MFDPWLSLPVHGMCRTERAKVVCFIVIISGVWARIQYECCMAHSNMIRFGGPGQCASVYDHVHVGGISCTAYISRYSVSCRIELIFW